MHPAKKNIIPSRSPSEPIFMAQEAKSEAKNIKHDILRDFEKD